MTPDELKQRTAELIKESEMLVEKAVNDAILATTALATGNFEEYWKQVGVEAQERMNERYQRAKDNAQSDQSSD